MTDTRAHIAVYCPDRAERDEWVNALRAELPDFAVDDQIRADSRYAVVWSPEADFFGQATGLAACFTMGAGVDSLLRQPTLPSTLPIYRLQDAGMGIQMARYCRHEVEHFRLMHYRYERQQSVREWIRHDPKAPEQIAVGLLGFGVLGRQVAQALLAEGHPVHAFRRSGGGEQDGVRIVSGDKALPQFLQQSQVLIVIAPLTAQTRGIINRDTLQWLPDGAYLINVGRGPLVDEGDLVDALARGKLAGATLDVFATEPLPANSSLWSAPNLRITPHVSALTLVPESARQIADKIAVLQSGGQPGGLVQRANGY